MAIIMLASTSWRREHDECLRRRLKASCSHQNGSLRRIIGAAGAHVSGDIGRDIFAVAWLIRRRYPDEGSASVS